MWGVELSRPCAPTKPTNLNQDPQGKAAMRYDDFRRSDDIEDRRDEGGGFGGGGGGGFGLPMGGGGLGIGTIIVLGLGGYAF